jgi:hypothetical protein
MKRQVLVRELMAGGCVLHRHGNRHDIYRNPAMDSRRQCPDTERLPTPFAPSFAGNSVWETSTTADTAMQ